MRVTPRTSFLGPEPLRIRLPPRGEAPALPAVFAPLPFPLRCPIAEAGFPFRAPGVTFAEWVRALPFPLLRLPFVALEATCLPCPLPFPFFAPFPFEVQRAPAAGRDPFEERAAEGRVAGRAEVRPAGLAEELRPSVLPRRAVRLLDEDCAGLRSRE